MRDADDQGPESAAALMSTAIEREHLCALLMKAPVGFAVLRGESLIYELANPFYLELAQRQDILGKALLDVFPEMQGQGIIELIRRTLQTGEIWQSTERLIKVDRNQDGVAEDCWFSFVGVPTRGATPDADRIMFVVYDVTEQVLARERAEKVQRELARSEAVLREAALLRDEFLSVASHELRTPLTTIQLQADALVQGLERREPQDASIERALRRAGGLCREVNRLERLLEGMTEVFRLSSREVELELVASDLGELTRAVVDRVLSETQAASIRVRTDPVPGMWDRARFTQALSQLLLNALKFGAREPIDVDVTANEDSARVTVSDRGMGIAAEDQARIFGRYEKATSARHHGGFGVGLWIVRELIEAMAGSIHVESAPGMGATFVVVVPIRR
jgi:signal transduction histidine kinase